MKKLGFLLVMLCLGTINVGCGGDAAPKDKTKDTPAADADGAADGADADGGDAEAADGEDKK